MRNHIKSLISSRVFELSITLIILLNAALVGIELSTDNIVINEEDKAGLMDESINMCELLGVENNFLPADMTVKDGDALRLQSLGDGRAGSVRAGGGVTRAVGQKGQRGHHDPADANEKDGGTVLRASA